MAAIRTAIIGYGRSGSTLHAGAIETLGDFEMVAVSDPQEECRAAAAGRFGCATYTDYRDMLSHEDIELAVIVSRSDQHCEMACACLDAAVNVLVTKPWALDEAEALRMVETWRTSGMQLLPWLPARWGCDSRRIREIVHAGALGDVFVIRRAVSGFGVRSDWQTELRYGGGYLLNWGNHIIDPPLLVADSPVASVYGHLRKVNNPGTGDDMFLALLRLASGALVQAEYTVSAEPLYDWFVQGTHGTIAVRGNALTLRQSTPASPGDPTQYARMAAEEDRVTVEALEGDPYGEPNEVYTAVARALRGEAEYPVTPHDALDLTRILDAIRLSSAENRVVHLHSS